MSDYLISRRKQALGVRISNATIRLSDHFSRHDQSLLQRVIGDYKSHNEGMDLKFITSWKTDCALGDCA